MNYELKKAVGYDMAKKIVDCANNLVALDAAGMEINHQTNYGSDSIGRMHVSTTRQEFIGHLKDCVRAEMVKLIDAEILRCGFKITYNPFTSTVIERGMEDAIPEVGHPTEETR
jgi:hypothetical protein